MKKRCTSSAITIIAVALLACTVVMAAGQWPTFRRDNQRKGVADSNSLSAGSATPIWVFPKTPNVRTATIDDGAATMEPAASWDAVQGLAYGASMHVAVTDGAGAATALYEFNTSSNTGTVGYNVWAYIPEKGSLSKSLSSDAHYTISVGTEIGGVWTERTSYSYTLDQSSGATWIKINGDGLIAVRKGERLRVTLSNETDNTAGSEYVAADAIEIEAGVGSIVASPVVSSLYDMVISAGMEHRYLETLGGVQDSQRSVGRVYAICTENDAATVWDDRGRHAWLKTGTTAANVDDPDQWLAFPEDPANWIQGDKAASLSSSPTIFTYDGDECAAIAAGDGQVYVVRTKKTLDAGETRLVWQGPGYLVDDAAALTPTYSADWETETGQGRQGTEYRRILSAKGGTATATWAAPVDAGKYSIYVWLPPSTSTEPHSDRAEYTVNFQGSGSTKTTYTYRIDQRNGGQWIRLGTTFSVTSGSFTVKLSNNYGDTLTPASDMYVVADAVKIVPGDLGAFDMSSPVVDSDGLIYVASTNGRVYCLKVGQTQPVWTFPDPTQTPTITNQDNARYPAPNAVGAFYASPALSSDESTLYIGSSDGHVYALNTADGTRKWRYPDADSSYLSPITSTTAVGDVLYVGTSTGDSSFEYNGATVDASGRILALTPGGSSATPKWWYPALTDDSVGYFEQASPLLMTIGTDDRLFLGSADGNLYGVDASTGQGLDESGAWTKYPDLGGAIFSSAAGGYMSFSGTDTPYGIVGSQANLINSVNLNTGIRSWYWGLLGNVISSPAIANDRFYIGDTGGYTWGFSTRLNGDGSSESWNTEISAEPPTEGSTSGAAADPEVDVFDETEYNDFATWAAGSDEDGWHEKTGLTSTAPPYEWGETMYVIVWNIKDNSSTITLRFRNKARGSDAGTEDKVTIPPGNASSVVTTNGKTIWYVKYPYKVYGDTTGKSATPGSRTAVYVDEKTGGSSSMSGTNYAPDTTSSDSTLPERYFQINNPLGLAFEGMASSTIGGEGGYGTSISTTRDRNDAHMNGNRANNVVLYQNPTNHNATSTPKHVEVLDRSKMYQGLARALKKVRVEKQDMVWTGGSTYVVSALPWEALPTGAFGGTVDYPDIPFRDILTTVDATSVDPSKVAVSITHSSGTSDSSWTAGRTQTSVRVSVPHFQPANLNGYFGRVRVYVDSNGNGQLDRPGHGSRSLQSATNAEAYRSFTTAVQVPVDRRVQIVEKVLDIGQVPHGFGLVPDENTDKPVAFWNNLTDNYTNSWTNTTRGFKTWWIPFTAYNVGNTNLLNVRAYQSGLTSDSVQYWSIPGTHDGDDLLSRTGGACVSTALDSTFWGNSAPWTLSSKKGDSRTFHKARVGEDAPELTVPDLPTRLYTDATYGIEANDLDDALKQPAVSVAVPIGQPVGRYTGKLTLFEDIDNTGRFRRDLDNPSDSVNSLYTTKSLGDPTTTLTVTVTEARLTGGVTPGTWPHLDDGSVALGAGQANSVSGVGNVSPAIFREPNTGELQMVWASNRYPNDILGTSAGAQTPNDPWLLYISRLKLDDNLAFDYTSTDPMGWWLKTSGSDDTLSAPFPTPSRLYSTASNTLFPAPSTSEPYVGAPGDSMPNSFRMYSPSVAVDPKIDDSAGYRRSWLFFAGNEYKLGTARVPEYRLYATEITRGQTDNGMYAVSSDWTMPKFGVRGMVTERDLAGKGTLTPWLWGFWYGGNGSKWNIYYAANPSLPDSDTSGRFAAKESKLAVASGLTTVSNPSPVYRPQVGASSANDYIDVIYSGFSSYFKNSDIYLSSYKPGASIDATKKTVSMAQANLYLRGATLFCITNGSNLTWSTQSTNSVSDLASQTPYVELARDLTRGVWYSKDVDWNPSKTFKVYLFPNRDDLTTYYQITSGSASRDAKTGSYVYSYPDQTDATQSALRALVRGAVVDPVSGTVKFMRAPGKDAIVAATFVPRSFRLTTDAVSDTEPFALLDYDYNPRYTVVDEQPTESNPFILDKGQNDWDEAVAPRTDRLWVFWRRPSQQGKAASGIYYKTYRYSISLPTRVALDEAKKPMVTNLEAIADSPMSGWTVSQPVEIDWVKGKLYFTSYEEGNWVSVEYTDTDGNTRTVLAQVQLTEEMGSEQQGTVFGSLSQVMMNEGQISAFKDRIPLEGGASTASSRVWVTWTSTRSGNSEVYYEAISPRFYGDEYYSSMTSNPTPK